MRWFGWLGALGILAEVGQALGAEEFLELFGGEEVVFEDEFGDAFAGGEGFLGDRGGGGVAEVGV